MTERNKPHTRRKFRRAASHALWLSAAALLCALGPMSVRAQGAGSAQSANPPSAGAGPGPQAAVPAASVGPRTADYILAVVNQELVTHNELQQRLARIRED